MFTARTASAIATLGLGVFAGWTSLQQIQQAGGGRTIELITTCTAINDFVDVGPLGPSPGDIYVFQDDVFTPELVPAGISVGRANLIDPATGAFEATGSFVLEGGTITVSGILYNVPGVISVGTITGGTGAYRGARGEVRIDLGSTCPPHQVTLSLTR
jgi:hypothetical protein